MPGDEFFIYLVRGIVWTSSGAGKHWEGSVTLGQRADSSLGMGLLRQFAAEQAKSWLRDQGFSPSGQFDLTQWDLKDA